MAFSFSHDTIGIEGGLQMKKILEIILSLVLFFALFVFKVEFLNRDTITPSSQVPSNQASVVEDGWYSSKEEVAEYIEIYEELPDNFITKDEAIELGWDNSKGNLWDVAEGMSIGGDRFMNREGLLPDEKGRIWTECDINYEGGYRGAERIVFSNDGLIYYTDDHYESFECLSGE